MERYDKVNDSLTLIQKTEGLTFGTDALLLAGFVSGKYKRCLEMGSGSGIISMLLLSREKASEVTAVEVQEEYALLTKQNAELNGLSDRLFAVCSDIRDYKSDFEYDLVFTNPPYMKATSGKACELSKKNAARHEIFGDIGDFCKEARRLLKFGGDFAVVYRPDRLCDLIYSMRSSGIEPKRMTTVYADTSSEPSMVLIVGRAGGRCGLINTPPLIIYRDAEHKFYTDEMNFIMENGRFPDKFER